MAFWGVEVKPGKPVTHSCEKARGRLRISQATLGISAATNKSIVQCNVGKRSPVLLCVLLPNHSESCHLDLEFEEADDVVFSVIGARSVYLTGYYVRQTQQSNPHSDTESFGMDIQNTQSEESSCHSGDDNYEDSFIDDNEVQEFSPSPVSSNNEEDETPSENDKRKNGKGHARRLRKKSQVVESGEDATSHESEDDGFLLSVFKTKRAAKKSSTGVEANNVNQDLPTSNGNDKMHACDLENPKKKRKERPKKEKPSEVQIDKDHGAAPGEDNKHEVEASNNLSREILDQEPPESNSGNRKKSKKRRKTHLEGTSETIDVKFHNVDKDDKLEPDVLHTGSERKNLPEANGVVEQQIDFNANIKSESLVDDNQPEKKTKKKTKKKKKNQGEGDLNVDMTNNQENTLMTIENQNTDTKAMQNRTLSNGLIIEEVANGPPDGKVASRGKKVKIIYTAMLKENGHVFDSNVGKSASTFRLGDEEITDGLNLGIEGMHVGDKRRLIIPPSMSSGKHGAGENVPPNSWLVYDVELVSIRR